MRLRTEWPVARSRQRRREFEVVFAGIPPASLGDMLEVGSGDGFLAGLLAPLGRSLTTTEPAAGRPRHACELPRLRCSVLALPVADASFDFIFSSSVLEHVRDRECALAELRRCLRPRGVMVHLMPSPTWKLLQLCFYYPHLAVAGIELLGAPKAGEAAGEGEGEAALPADSTERWREPGKSPGWWAEFKRGAWPQVHGEFDGHVKELMGFRASTWAEAFRQAGFEVRGQLRLPLYSGYGFGLERLRRAGERCGLSAHTGFLVTHPEAPLSAAWRWSSTGRPS
jgi:SAM-dependent methyltransferase